MEMIAAIDTNILASQPTCIPTDWQAGQIAYKDLGNRHISDENPLSNENARLANKLSVRSFLQMREESGVLRGKIKFDEYRVVTNLTSDRAAIDIATHYEMQIKAVEELFWGESHTRL